MTFKSILAFFATTVSLAAVSCKKSSDTPSKSAEELITANAWKPAEVRALKNNSALYYQRGAAGNTINLDNESMIFRADGTGTYTDNAGGSSAFTWSFTDAAKTKLTWTVQFAPPATVFWEKISLKEGSLSYTEYYTQAGSNILGVVSRIPK